MDRFDFRDPQIKPSSTDTSFALSGYDRNLDIPPQAFAAEDMVFFGDGQCSSSCTILDHFLKWQGKVKSIIAGGRPRIGPMQAMGEKKGATVYGLLSLLHILDDFAASPSDFAIETANESTLRDLARHALYVVYRSTEPGEPETVSVNIRNQIAQDDDTQTPLLFLLRGSGLLDLVDPEHAVRHHDCVAKGGGCKPWCEWPWTPERSKRVCEGQYQRSQQSEW